MVLHGLDELLLLIVGEFRGETEGIEVFHKELAGDFGNAVSSVLGRVWTSVSVLIASSNRW